MSSQSLRSIADNPNHPLHTHAKAELSRRTQREEKTLTPAELKKREKIAKAIEKDNPDMPMDKKMAIATATAKRVAEAADDFKPHMMYDPKTGKEYYAKTYKDHVRMGKMGYTHEKPKTEGAMKRIATTQSNKADRIAAGGKKGLETFKQREMQNETKGAPKGYHFTRSGKLRKGDAGADGPGGAKLRSDPLDKQRSKIPPLPEKYDEPQGQAKRMMSPLQKARMDKEKADRDRDGKLMNVKTKTKTEATMKSFSEISRSKLGSYAEATDDDYHKTLGPTKNSDEGIAALKKKHGMSHTKAVATMKRLMGEGKVDEISMGKMQAYGKAAAKDIDQKRNKVKAALDQPASVKHAKAGMKAMQGLTKRSRGSDMYVDKMTGRSKVKPTAEETVNELDKKTLGSYIKKAGPDAVKQTAQAKRHADAGDMADKDRDMYKHYGKSQRAMDKAKNRQKGISKAVDKLTREATIPDGQTAMTKRPELTSSDAEKLAKIRKMLNREKKK